MGKAFRALIFHLNGNKPVAVSCALKTKVEWRHEWGTYVAVDTICYRRTGHNDMDQPVFTQPKLYKDIKEYLALLNIYKKRLIKEGAMTKEEAKDI